MFKFSKKTIHVNEEQKKAITRPKDTNQRIIASAGSGKTTTITARIAIGFIVDCGLGRTHADGARTCDIRQRCHIDFGRPISDLEKHH